MKHSSICDFYTCASFALIKESLIIFEISNFGSGGASAPSSAFAAGGENRRMGDPVPLFGDACVPDLGGCGRLGSLGSSRTDWAATQSISGYFSDYASF